MDGNFSADHLHMRRPKDDVQLSDGSAFMVTQGPYNAHLKIAKDTNEVISLLHSLGTIQITDIREANNLS